MSTARPQPDIDATARLDLQQRADREVARRSVPGGPAYLVILGMLALLSGEVQAHATAFTAAGAAFTVLASMRTWCAFRILRRASTPRLRRTFHTVTVLLGFTWGLFVAHMVAVHPEVMRESWMPLLALLFNGALASGAAASYAAAPREARYGVLAMQGPIILSLAFLGQGAAWGLAVVVSVFVLYLFFQIHNLGHAYWSALHDNAELERQRRELEVANGIAQSAAQARERFLANMSHELRTPLNGIIGLTSLSLDDGNLDDETRTYLEHVKASAEGMVSLIKQVLDFSEATQGRLSLRTHDFVLHDILAKLGGAHGAQAHRKNLEFIVDIDPSLPAVFQGDAYRLGQVLDALVSNAIKFTSSGEVILCVGGERGVSPSDPAGWHLRFSVSDTGRGIPKEHCEEIFAAFSQVDGSLTRQHQGAGLGLALAANIVELMGGRIELSSSLSRGSVFTVDLDFAEGSHLAESPPPTAIEFDGPVCLIDSNERSAETVERAFQAAGAELRRFASAAEVRAEWGRLFGAPTASSPSEPGAGDTPQPFFLVYGPLSDASAIECVSMLLQLGTPPRRILPALRNTDLQRSTRDLSERGVTAFLVRPILPGALCRAVGAAMSAHAEDPSAADSPGPSSPLESTPDAPTPESPAVETPGSPATTPPSPPSGAPASTGLRILLAEDNRVNQKVATRLLQREGYQVTVAEDGKEAVKVLEGASFDLVLTDLQMPRMDGFQLAQHIRRSDQETGHHTPLVAVTAHCLPEDIERCREAGMDGFVAKPIKVDQLRDALASALGEARAA